MNLFEFDISRCVDTLNRGGLILYPTDTIWGIGCDATNAGAVEKIYALKKRSEQKSMIILLADEKDIHHYAQPVSPKIKDLLSKSEKPLTIIYPHAKNLAENLVGADHTIAIRIAKDEFCKLLIHTFGKPLVSTSANISGEKAPENFNSVSDEIKGGVDHIVLYRQDDDRPAVPSRIVKWDGAEKITVIRE